MVLGCSWQQPMPALSIPSPETSLAPSRAGGRKRRITSWKALGLAVDRRVDKVILVPFHSLGGPPHPSHASENQQAVALPPGDEEQVAALVSCAEPNEMPK